MALTLDVSTDQIGLPRGRRDDDDFAGTGSCTGRSPYSCPVTVEAQEADAPARGRSLRRAWLMPLVLFLAALAVYGATAARGAVSVDTHAASVEAWRIASTGSPWLENVMDDHLAKDWFLSEAPNGHVVAQRTAGPVLAGIPFYWLLDRGDTANEFDVLAGGIAAATLTAVTVLLMYLALARLLCRRQALVATLAFAFATPTWSVSADALWTHTVTQLGIAGAAFSASRDRWWLTGVFLGVGMFGRPHMALIAAVVGVGLGLTRRSFRPMLAVGTPAVLALGLVTVWNHWMFGVWSIGGAYGNKLESAASGFNGSAEFDAPHVQLLNYLGFLVSPDRGFLVWSPLLLVLLPAMVRAWREAPDWSRWLAVGGVLYTFFQLRLNYFAGGDFFYGYRHGLELLTCLVPLAALAWQRSGRRARRAAAVVATLQLAAIGLGAITNGFALPLEDAWSDNSFWVALRSSPATIGCWVLLCGAFVALGTRLSNLRRSSAAEVHR
jgi:alpha-1,2-mannosyltransferase